MDHFSYRNGEMHAEDVALSKIASAIGTPFYCYSTATLERHFKVFEESIQGLDHLTCYALKANSNLAVIQTLARLGSGADVVSEGEIRRALKAGITPDKIVFSGVGKTKEEMRFALQQHIYQFNVESEPELLLLNETAGEMGKKAPIAIRVNPDVDAKTHAKISTGKKENKFGISLKRAPEIYKLAASLPHIAIQGISMHIGSQLTELAPYDSAFAILAETVEMLRGLGIPMKTVDVGGGLGIPYGKEAPPLPAEYGKLVHKHLSNIKARLIFEPGRMLVGNAGILVSKVVYVKREGEKTFLILDAGMNDLIRPSLYEAYHAVLPVKDPGNAKLAPADIVGPVCESGDVFAKDRMLPPLAPGDLVVFRTAGAYGAAMASTYNSRPLIAEVQVRGEEFIPVRKRQTYDELLSSESMLPI